MKDVKSSAGRFKYGALLKEKSFLYLIRSFFYYIYGCFKFRIKTVNYFCRRNSLPVRMPAFGFKKRISGCCGLQAYRENMKGDLQ